MSAPPNASPKQVQCPQCRALSNYSPENRFRPFCSERCRLLDLGAWATDRYTIAGAPLETPLDATGADVAGSDKPFQ